MAGMQKRIPTPSLRTGPKSNSEDEKGRKFIDAYLETGNVTASALAAGYTSRTTGTSLLKKKWIADEIAKRRAADTRVAVAKREERLSILSNLARGFGGAKPQDQIAAAKLLAQMDGELIQKHHVSGADGGAIRMDIQQLSITDLIRLLQEVKAK